MQLRHPRGHAVERTLPAKRLRKWRHRSPQVRTPDRNLAAVLRRSVEDIGALRIFDPEHPRGAVVAAGAPWFMALFGRDSLLTVVDAAAAGPGARARHPADASRLQGRRDRPRAGGGAGPDPARGPLRPGRLARARRPQRATTAPSTPRRCSSCCSASCSGGAATTTTIAALLPHADRALDWIERYGDADGDGFVEYRAQDRPRPGQPGLEGLLGRHQLRRRDHRRGAHRAGRGAGLLLRGLPWPAPSSPAAVATADGRAAGATRPTQLKRDFNERVLAAGRGLVRGRPGRATSGRSTR